MNKLAPIPRRKWEKFLESQGCVRKRQKASHIIYSKKGLPRPIIFQTKNEVSPHIIKSNLQTLGISLQEFFKQIAKL